MRLAMILATVAASAVFTGATAQGEDWPKYLGPRGDLIATEKITETWPAEGPKQLWTAKVGVGYSTPVVVGGKVYINALKENKEFLQALDAATGKQLWATTVGAAWTQGGMGYAGTRATPTVEGDTIYTYSGKGDLSARNIADGKVVWTLNVLMATNAKDLQWGCASSPAVYGDVIYVQGGNGGAIAVAVNKKTGKILWQTEKGLASYATPVQIDVGGVTQVVVAAGKAIYGFDAKTGKTLWSVPWVTDYDINAATPIYRDGKLLVTSGYKHGSIMLEVSPTGAKELWQKKSLQGRFPTPILDGDMLIGNSEGTLVALNWKTGDTLWTGKDRIGSGGSLLRVNGDKLIVLSERGKLSLVKTAENKVENLATFTAADGQNVWSSPVVSDGKLFVKGAEDLTCFDVSVK